MNNEREMTDPFSIPAVFEDDLSKVTSDKELFTQINQALERPLKYILTAIHEKTPDAGYIRKIHSESDPLTLVIKAHLFVENLLDRMIRKKFNHSKRLRGSQMNFLTLLDILRAKNYLNKKLYRDITLLNHLRHKFVLNPLYDISEFNLSKFHYCHRIGDYLQDNNKEFKRETNIYILKIILCFLIVRISNKHFSAKDLEIQGF